MGRKRIGDVGNQTSGALACPQCGGQQFAAKRSKTGKTVGVVTLGVGAVLAPKTQVKCVTCGTMYKRGGTAELTSPADHAAPAPIPGWYPDPTGRHQLRWHDGTTWGPAVMDNGQQGTDPP
jgi:hypothetical protein